MATKVYKRRIGGMLRCTALSLDDYQVEKPQEQNDKEGDIVQCKWCSQSVIFRDGAWEWNQAQGEGASAEVPTPSED